MSNKPVVEFARGEHKGNNVVFIRFDYNLQIIGIIKPLGALFSRTNRCWYAAADGFDFALYGSNLKDVADIAPGKGFAAENGADKYSKEVVFELNPGENLVYLKFNYDDKIIQGLTRLQGLWYHVGAKILSVPNTEEHIEQAELLFRAANYSVSNLKTTRSYSKTREFKKQPGENLIPEKYNKQLKLENKSVRTIEIYESFINHFLHSFKGVEPKDIPMDDIRNYILYQREHLGYSESYQNQLINALKSFFRIMYRRELDYKEIPRPKKSRSLPKVLSKQEVERIINTPANLKHRLILAILYGCGLRLNELICLEVGDINFNNRTVLVINGKGRKDRRVPLPKPLIPLLEQYIKSYLPEKYLFFSQGQIQYSSSSVQKLVKEYTRKAGIEKHVTPHTLRHCYATHMLEKGVDLRYIQELLGHQSSKTTEIYTHVTTRKLGELGNPLDDITF